jgi:biopolymer transport protein ExbB
MNLTSIFLQFAMLGAEWVMWLLILLSVISIAIMIDRAIFFISRQVNIEQLSQELTHLLQALDLVRDSSAIECVVPAAGLSERHRGLQSASEAMLTAKLGARLEMETRLGILGTLGNNAPFIGLLGTVLGIIKASTDLAGQAKGAAANAVMAGVFEALVATAVGLFVAIPAVMAYNYFLRKVRSRSAQADMMAHLVLTYWRPETAEAPPIVKPIPQEV